MRWPDGTLQLNSGRSVMIDAICIERAIRIQGAYVYAHSRQDTGDIFYIGKGTGRRAWSSNSRNRRWKHIVAFAGRDVWLVARSLTHEEAFELEQKIIASFDGALASYTAGGMGAVGYRHTAKARAAMSRARSGRPLPEDVRIKMSSTIKNSEALLELRCAKFLGENNPAKRASNRKQSSERMSTRNPMTRPDVKAKMIGSLKGRSLDVSVRKKISNSLLGRTRGPMKATVRIALDAVRERRKRAVKTECGLRFSSTADAARALGVRQGNIVNNCAGRAKSAGGYIWSYDDKLA